MTHDTRIANQVDRVVAIRDGKTSTERVRRVRTAADGEPEVPEQQFENTVEAIAKMEEHVTYHEYVVLDAAGRLQIPREYLEKLGISDRAQVDLTEEGILIKPAMGLESTAAQTARVSEVAETWGPQQRSKDWKLGLAMQAEGCVDAQEEQVM